MLKNEIKLPKTPLQLYVKLYCCKNKGITASQRRNAVIEATKSWLSLSTDEKQKITKKFTESNAQYKNKVADYLKSAEPYLKKKKFRRKPEESTVQHLNQEENQDAVKCNTIDEQISFTAENAINGSQIEGCEEKSILEEQSISNPLTEPTPPNISSGKQLYDLITRKNLTDSNWFSLSKLEKSRYQKAVLMLKKDYIKKYRDYLESLSSEELFNYSLRK